MFFSDTGSKEYNMCKKVAIILVNWNSFGYTQDCIRSLYEMPYKDYDIILVDNGSKDDSGERLASLFPDMIYLKIIDNVGFTGGNNLALNYSINRKYTYSLLLNNDTFVTTGFLEPLVNYMDQNPGVGGVQPKIYYNHDRRLLWNAGSYYNAFTGMATTEGLNKTKTRTSEQLKNVDWLTGCALLTRNSIIRDIGLLDESLFMYYEDVDFSFRIKNAGYSLVYFPGSHIYHIAGVAYKSKTRQKEGFLSPFVLYVNFRNKIWMQKKYTRFYQWPSAFLVSLFYYSAVLVYFILRGRFVKLKTTFKAIKDGVGGRMTGKYSFDKNV